MAKNNKKNKPKQHKTSNSCSKTAIVPALTPDESPQSPQIIEPLSQEQAKVSYKTLIGVIQTDLYETLLKPAFLSFSLHRNDEPLRQLVESIVTSINANDSTDEYKKIENICQRYLYYLESAKDASKLSPDGITAISLCDYWRTQTFMMLIHDSYEVFSLLIPDQITQHPVPKIVDQDCFLKGIDIISNQTVGMVQPTQRNYARFPEIYDFAHGMSFPWLGYDSTSIFNINALIPDEDLKIKHEFAIINASHTPLFYQWMQNSIHQALLIDLISCQYKKLYEDICQAFDDHDLLPKDFLNLLEQKVKLDRNYQSAYNYIMSGNPIETPLHRSSRLPLRELNAISLLAHTIQTANEIHHGVYIFHYIEQD